MLTVTSVSAAVPLSITMPPPNPAPEFCVTIAFVSESVPLLMMAPPEAAPGLPFWMVT